MAVFNVTIVIPDKVQGYPWHESSIFGRVAIKDALKGYFKDYNVTSEYGDRHVIVVQKEGKDD